MERIHAKPWNGCHPSHFAPPWRPTHSLTLGDQARQAPRLPRLPLLPRPVPGRGAAGQQGSTAVLAGESHEAQKSSRMDPGEGARRVETNDDADPLSAIARLRLPYPAELETVGYDEKTEL